MDYPGARESDKILEEMCREKNESEGREKGRDGIEREREWVECTFTMLAIQALHFFLKSCSCFFSNTGQQSRNSS